MRHLAIIFIEWYQIVLSPDRGIFSKGPRYCRFFPSCSEYTKEAIRYGGVWYGVKKGVTRIIRCHPWQKDFIEPFIPSEGEKAIFEHRPRSS
ncbi:MAG: membrane protein insertion efficiency factor YidD [Patescibacteria group bacterium]